MELHPGQDNRHVPEEKSVELDPIRRALRENEDWYRDLVEHSRDLLCIHDLQGRLLSINLAPARALGYTVEELLQIPMREIIAPEFRDQFDAYLGQIAHAGEASGLMAVVTRTGERRIWEYYNTLRTEGVASPIVRGMAHDITDRMRADNALRERDERFRVALKNSPITVFNQDRDLRYTWMYNPHLPLPVSEQLGKTPDEIFDPEEAARITEVRRRVLTTGVGVRHEMQATFDGRKRYFDTTIEPLFDRAGAVIGITGASMDVTELRTASDALAEAKRKLTEEKLYLEQEIDSELGFGEIIGQSKALKAVMQQVGQVASSDATVLLLGETGSGKELVARRIHRLSRRQNTSFIKLNCAAIPSGLLESELFGYEKGGFTGAVNRKIGRLELADKGTLFLDEIGEIPLHLQPKLLRVLQDQEFERLGGTHTLKVNFRLIAASNRNLPQSVKERRFRSDLFYRLNVFPIRVPPLRERREDIPLLVEHFVRRFASRMNRSIASVPKKTMEALAHWDWPGNVRELENFIEHSVILTQGSVLAAPLSELTMVPKAGVPDTPRATERERILRVLRDSHGQLSGPHGAAARLGLPRAALQAKLKQLGIEPQHYRD